VNQASEVRSSGFRKIRWSFLSCRRWSCVSCYMWELTSSKNKTATGERQDAWSFRDQWHGINSPAALQASDSILASGEVQSLLRLHPRTTHRNGVSRCIHSSNRRNRRQVPCIFAEANILFVFYQSYFFGLIIKGETNSIACFAP